MLPTYPGGQRHRKSPNTVSTHVPPLWQGLHRQTPVDRGQGGGLHGRYTANTSALAITGLGFISFGTYRIFESSVACADIARLHFSGVVNVPIDVSAHARLM